MEDHQTMKGETVCVTGSSGFIGSWLVQLLLNRGYTVHATVQDLNDKKETAHLLALEGADENNLKLFQMDLLDYDSIVAAVKGTAGVFHLASPNVIGKVQDPQKELLEPAIDGTKNVITAAKEVGVKRVVVTSSISSIVPSPNWPVDVPKSEACWTDEDYCKKNELWYPLSKLWAEKAAWDVAAEKGVEVAVVNPATVLGPVLPPILNSSMAAILGILQGSTETYADFYMGCVHVKDVAMAHILLLRTNLQLEGICAAKIFLISATWLLRLLSFTLNIMLLGSQKTRSQDCLGKKMQGRS